MPRITALRIGALSDLARQLRYVPRRTLVRQLRSVEELASRIDPAAVYDEVWVIQQITGYRPDVANPAALVGEALLGDLSAFVEAVSDEARLTEADLGDDAVALANLCAAWGVSRKTIERWRRRGLVAYRVREARGRVRLAFRREGIRWFEERRGEDIARAGAFRRVDSTTSGEVVEKARRLRSRFGWSLNETAQRLADRSGLAHETVRRMLQRYDAVSRHPIFGEPGPLTERQRRVILRAHRRGVPAKTLAERFGRTPATIRRVALRERAAMLRSLPAPRAPARALDEAGEAAALRSPVADQDLIVEPDPTLETFLQAAAASPPPDRGEERDLGAAAAALRRRATRLAAELDPQSPSAAAVDEAETALRWAERLQGKLAAMHRRWALSTLEGWTGRPLVEFSPAEIRRLHLLAMDALLAAALTYDPRGGGRLAAPAGVLLNRALAAWSADRGQGPLRAGGAKARPASVALADWTKRIAPWQAWLSPDPRLARLAPRLDEPARIVVVRRYGLEGAPPRTAKAIAAELGLTSGRAASLERGALRRARREAQGDEGGPTVG